MARSFHKLRRKASPRTGPQCPACGVLHLRAEEAENAYSRYAAVWICSDCGVHEALSGFFWKERCYSLNLGSKIKREFA